MYVLNELDTVTLSAIAQHYLSKTSNAVFFLERGNFTLKYYNTSGLQPLWASESTQTLWLSFVSYFNIH